MVKLRRLLFSVYVSCVIYLFDSVMSDSDEACAKFVSFLMFYKMSLNNLLSSSLPCIVLSKFHLFSSHKFTCSPPHLHRCGFNVSVGSTSTPAHLHARTPPTLKLHLDYIPPPNVLPSQPQSVLQIRVVFCYAFLC